jgi:hypothetical protein
MRPEKRRKRWPTYADDARIDIICEINNIICDLFLANSAGTPPLEAARKIAKAIDNLRLIQQILNDVRMENYEYTKNIFRR